MSEYEAERSNSPFGIEVIKKIENLEAQNYYQLWSSGLRNTKQMLISLLNSFLLEAEELIQDDKLLNFSVDVQSKSIQSLFNQIDRFAKVKC